MLNKHFNYFFVRITPAKLGSNDFLFRIRHFGEGKTEHAPTVVTAPTQPTRLVDFNLLPRVLSARLRFTVKAYIVGFLSCSSYVTSVARNHFRRRFSLLLS